VNNLHIISS